MGEINLSEIKITPLRRIATDGGDVMHVIKQSDVGYNGFGEAYFSLIQKGAVKAWKCHTKMTMNIIVPVGCVRFVFHCRKEQNYRVEEIGVDNYNRITVPPGIWFGFQGLIMPVSLILNVANIPHDPTEVERLPEASFTYPWETL